MPAIPVRDATLVQTRIREDHVSRKATIHKTATMVTVAGVISSNNNKDHDHAYHNTNNKNNAIKNNATKNNATKNNHLRNGRNDTHHLLLVKTVVPARHAIHTKVLLK